MSVSRPVAESAAAILFTVRMEPYLVESICALSRLVRDKGKLHGDVSGLLFGKVKPGFRTVEALKTFPDAGAHGNLARRERVERVYAAALQEAKHDPELNALKVVGWFSFRSGTGLVSSDVIFHNEHFGKPEDVALIIWREGPSQITAEFYAKPDERPLTTEEYRWGSVRLSADIRHMRESIELAMRVKVAGDSNLNGYESDEPDSRISAIMHRAGAMTGKLFGFLHKRKEEYEDADLDIGIRRSPNRNGWRPEEAAGAPAANPAEYFNPDVEPATKPMGRLSLDDIEKPAATATAAGASTAWPANSSAAAAAPAGETAGRQPEFRTVARTPPPSPSAPADLGSEFDPTRFGRNPRIRSVPAEVSGLPMLLPAPAVITKSSPWPWAVALFVVSATAVFAFLLLGGLQSEGGRISQAFSTLFPGAELNLHVATDDDRLRLTWNQRNAVVSAATGGTLQIFDGQQQRAVHLDGRQLADGAVLYRPVTNDVTFRLEVHSEQGDTTGSVRVLDGLANHLPLDVSAPGTAASHPGISPGALADSKDASLKDPDAPTLLRPAAGASAPVTDTPALPPPQHSAPAARHYEKPRTIGTYPEANGSTINSWDTSSSASRSKVPMASHASGTAEGFIPPRPLMQVMPRTSAIPPGVVQSRTQVKVEVWISTAGKVASARVVGAGAGASELLEAAALAAARQWTFEPASRDGHRVESHHTIVFQFRPQR